ncbi:DUF2935 domain-containing protein [Desulfosporosinus nitroreducens]|uniref:DUF2935 domain-containing protein n=1 Tax=Desulfosporosinus nitroreducens TaxID=2018668 RepID=UPI00207C9552|nr:DUF2935 domain-containing protein [Desulfosporosinus nitroreducens]MCO1604150.1 DUF2935 domain-containing protein [Desulfosporosinus nitroreducens]
MVLSQDFVRSSIELNLFFLRIMKEHLIFIEADLSQRDIHLSHIIVALRSEATNLLKTTIALANGHVSPQAVSSGEFITNYTFNAEKATEFFTGITIDKDVSNAELTIGSAVASKINSALVDQVAALNNNAIAVTQAISNFKASVLQDVLACRTYTHSYPLLLDHINREAQFYLRALKKIQKRVDFNLVGEAVEQEAFWNRIMGEHAKFVRGFLDPTEELLFDKAHRFGKEFERLTIEAISLNENISRFPEVTIKSMKTTNAIRNFKQSGVEGILGCKIKIVALPLIADHILREANHYLRMLKEFDSRR